MTSSIKYSSKHSRRYTESLDGVISVRWLFYVPTSSEAIPGSHASIVPGADYESTEGEARSRKKIAALARICLPGLYADAYNACKMMDLADNLTPRNTAVCFSGPLARSTREQAAGPVTD